MFPQSRSCHPRSFIDALLTGFFDSRQFFCSVYEPGLRFLIGRYLPEPVGSQCFDLVVTESIAAIVRGDVKIDHDIPAIVRRTVHRVIETMDTPSSPPRRVPPLKSPKITFDRLNEIQSRLMIFTSDQYQSLYRFYVNQEPASSICQDLDLQAEQFAFIRSVARRITMMNSEPSLVSAKQIRKDVMKVGPIDGAASAASG